MLATRVSSTLGCRVCFKKLVRTKLAKGSLKRKPASHRLFPSLGITRVVAKNDGRLPAAFAGCTHNRRVCRERPKVLAMAEPQGYLRVLFTDDAYVTIPATESTTSAEGLLFV